MRVERLFEVMKGMVEVGVDLYDDYEVYGVYDLDDENDCVCFLQLYGSNEVEDFYAKDSVTILKIVK